MWIVIILAVIIVILIIALMIAYLDLRSTVEIMKNIIDLQNKRYMACIDGLERANQSVEGVLSLNDQIIKLNKRLYFELYGNKEDNDNECK